MKLISSLRKKSGLFILLTALLFGNAASAQLDPVKADSFFNFIKANPLRSSVYITRNDTVIARLNENKLMPLASTVGILIAIEFAQQSTHEMINENAYVSLTDIEKFYIPLIDSASYNSWLADAKAHNEIKDGTIKLVDIARGMITFGSYTVADYLMDLLGFDSVKENIALFKLKQHTAVYPFAGSLFTYHIPKKSSEDKLLKSLSKYSDKKYSMEAYYNHLDIKQDSTFKETFNPDKFTPRLMKMWNDNLPASTTKEYVMIAQALNNREVIDEDAYFPIAEVLEQPMEKKENQRLYNHYGAKTGKTAYIFTRVFYFTQKDKTRIESAIFLNDLTPAEEKKIEDWQPAFEAQYLSDPVFRSKVRF
ncbi:MAG: serine hydrolase [Chitinophagaceae bacterium]|nr:serine hydrolase [Chitinophagaceae bacterium]